MDKIDDLERMVLASERDKQRYIAENRRLENLLRYFESRQQQQQMREARSSRTPKLSKIVFALL